MFHKFPRLEQPSKRRLYTKSLKETFGDKHASYGYRLAISNELEIIGCAECEVAADGLKRVVLLLEVLCRIGCIRSAGLAVLDIFFYDSHQVLRIGKWQRPQQNRIHDAKHSDVGGDAERENHHGDHREAVIPLQCAESETQILRQNV